eukprot:15891583-Heterocapsa_arctica.AAC.1
MVQGGPKASSTNDGLTKDKLLQNKRDKVPSKKTSAAREQDREGQVRPARLPGGLSGDLTDDNKNKCSRMA